MNKKILFIPCIAEFVIIVILAIINFNNSQVMECNPEKDDSKDNYIYKDEIDYECILKNPRNDSEYIIIKNIKTDIKGKIIELKTEHQYIYQNEDKYYSMRDAYKIDESKYEFEFNDETKTMILKEKEPSEGTLGISIIHYDEYLQKTGYTCEIVK